MKSLLRWRLAIASRYGASALSRYGADGLG
jgi:hypothetical protein